MTPRTDVTGFVVAGGKSSRMGRDKAWIDIGGRPMIQHVISALKEVTANIAVIAKRPEYGELGFAVFADTHIGIGPIEAIRTALANCTTSYAIVVACDMPFVTPQLFTLLLDRVQGYDAVAPTDSEGRLEPLCAVYARAAGSAVTALVERGERKPTRIFDTVRTNIAPFSAVGHLPGAQLFFRNVNTPADYMQALQDHTLD